jgi:hypothetical protein
MPYTPPVDWEDSPSTDTPLNDTNITAMETALALWAGAFEGAVNATPVSSATSIDPPDNYLVHTISGTADIETISAQTAGKMIVLLFSGDAASAGLITDTGNLTLERSMLYRQGDTITLICDGTDWYEAGRSSTIRETRFADLESDAAANVNASVISAAGLGYVEHGVTAGVARPTEFAATMFVGSVAPTNGEDSDLWVDTT